MRKRAMLMCCCVLGLALPSSPAVAQVSGSDQTVRFMVDAFTDGDRRLRGVAVISVGQFARGVVVGIGFADPETRERVDLCFVGWTVQQFGEWLLQHWERSPEIWHRRWDQEALDRIWERLNDAGAC